MFVSGRSVGCLITSKVNRRYWKARMFFLPRFQFGNKGNCPRSCPRLVQEDGLPFPNILTFLISFFYICHQVILFLFSFFFLFFLFFFFLFFARTTVDFFSSFFSRMLRDSTPRYVGPSVGQLVIGSDSVPKVHSNILCLLSLIFIHLWLVIACINVIEYCPMSTSLIQYRPGHSAIAK